MPDTQLIDGSNVSLQQLLDLFLYYAHRRDNKVVKGLTDTLYTTREKSTRTVDGITEKGFAMLMEQAPGLIEGSFTKKQAMLCFSQNLPYSKDHVWELKFEHFLTALVEGACRRYPVHQGDYSASVAQLLNNHFLPLYEDLFGEEFLVHEGPVTAVSIAAKDNIRLLAAGAKRLQTNLVATPEGIMPPKIAAEFGLSTLDARSLTKRSSTRRASTFAAGGGGAGAGGSTGSPVPGAAQGMHTISDAQSIGSSSAGGGYGAPGGPPSGGAGRSRRQSFSAVQSPGQAIEERLKQVGRGGGGAGGSPMGSSAGAVSPPTAPGGYGGGRVSSPLNTQRAPPAQQSRTPLQQQARQQAAAPGSAGSGASGMAPAQADALVTSLQQLMAVVRGLQEQNAQLAGELDTERANADVLRGQLREAGVKPLVAKVRQ